MKKKTRHYSDPAELECLTLGLSPDQISALAGVTVATVKRWQLGTSPIPYAVLQLFKARCYGVIGQEWEGWKFSTDGRLYHPFWRRGFTGRDLAGLWYETQKCASLAAQVRQLAKDLEAAREGQEQAEKRAEFYRRQVGMEAKLGLALVRIGS